MGRRFDVIGLARKVLEMEAQGILALKQHLGDDFVHAVDLLYACQGRFIVTGVGKSGQIGHKIAATLASTGTPAFFLHAAEGLHGDLGMITRKPLMAGQRIQLSPGDGSAGSPVVAVVVHCTQTVQGYKVGCSICSK